VAERYIVLEPIERPPETIVRAQSIREAALVASVTGAVERHGLPLTTAPRCLGNGDEIANSPSDYSIDERGKPGPLGMVSRQTTP
jgi:hypothetical protein